ncbi:MAG: hypothetical protein ABI239_09530 [Aquihabitans sp.]
MRHARFDVATASLDRKPLQLKASYLLVAEADQGELPHWECLAYTVDDTPVPQGTYRVDITTLEGRYLMGDAVLVRSVDGAHVLRGTGVLHGITDEDLGPAD